MRNYVIINGVNSLTIQGLAINNLPPITKPMIRTQREEIDGRDGDIVTELGYSAYDKQIEIGLWGTYDINDIIKYFTGEGTIVFSNEDDKYYNFKILDQIDYQKLLKFKTATITLHCQPFKYPLEEEPVEAEITTLTGTGETLTLNNTEEAPMSLVYKGNTLQNGTPTPETPQDIHVVSGDNSIEICGKNLFDKNTLINGYYLNTSGNLEANANYAVSQFINVTPGEQYYIPVRGTTRTKYYLKDKTAYSNTWDVSDVAQVITIPNNVYFIRITVAIAGSTQIDVNTFQFEKGSTATTYEAYQGASYPISLGDIQLLNIPNTDYYDKIDKSSGKNLLDYSTCVIGDINGSTGQDEAQTMRIRSDFIKIEPSTSYVCSLVGGQYTTFFYTNDKTYIAGGGASWINSGTSFTTPNNAEYVRLKFWKGQNTAISLSDLKNVMFNIGSTALPYEPYGNGDWYLKKEIGELDLSSIPYWSKQSNGKFYLLDFASSYGYKINESLSNLFTYSSTTWVDNCFGITGAGVLWIATTDTTITGYDAFQTWLGNKGAYMIGVKSTPTYTLIEDSTLIEELESMKKSYENQTNISQTNNDLPFELDVSVTLLTPMEINNIGNIYAKPILTIEGTGNIGVVLNDIQILDIDLTNNGKIAIDVTKLEAYNPDDDTLLNRLVTGDYMKLLINEGENTITFTGNVSSATLTNYIRWI